MNKKSLLLLLLLISWTVLSAQTQAYSPGSKDTTRCYTPAELRAIALKLVSGAECDTLLNIAQITIAKQDMVIKSQSTELDFQETRYITTEHMVDEITLQKDVLKHDLKKTKRRLLWVKVGWATTSVILAVTTVLALVK